MFRNHLATVFVLMACVLSLGSQGLCLNITSLSPSDYQIAALTQGARYYTDATHTITSIPLALTDGTLIRTEAADGSNPGLVVSFTVDVRAEVYICYDSRSAAPSWLSSWVATDMTVGVSDGVVGNYKVYAKRFSAGTMQLSANQSAAMYFVVVKESLPKLPRKGWVLLSYDMPYLREIVKKAPEYEVNEIQISHDIMMNTWEVLEQPTRRADVNEIINLAHAYGVTDVGLWTHEVCSHNMPAEYKAPAGHPAAGHADGNNPAMWEWLRGRYTSLLSPGTGCPEADGIVLTFSEVEDNVYQHQGDGNPGLPAGTGPEFKHDGYTQQESVAMLINNVEQVCAAFGKRLYARTWGSSGNKWEQPIIRDGILLNGDTAVWMMNKNVGGVDWPHMDTHQPLIGTLPPEFNELIEFDLGFEYYGRGVTTGCMTSYVKDHWNYDLERGVEGAVARIDRESNMAYYKSNRLNIYAFKEVLANRYVDPAAVNLAWCRQYFPLDIAQDIADHFDAPGSLWEGDTRYMMWEAYFPVECPINNAQALEIAYAALQRIDRHQPQLVLQTTLDTRNGVNDFITLHNGIVTAINRLGGTVQDYIPPSSPTNVVATPQSATMVLVTWAASTDNVGVTGYKVYRNGSQVGTSTTTSYLDSGLTQNTHYSYTVSAYDAMANNSAPSSPPATVTTPTGDTQPPSVPTDVTATAVSANSILVTWTASTDNIAVTGYKIYRNGSLVGTSATTSYTDNGLLSSTTFSYTISAYDGTGNDSFRSSPPATATTWNPDPQPPSVPTSVVATTLGVTSIRVTWTASTDNVGVAGYKVYRNGSQVGTSATTSYTDTGLSSSTTYSYTISAYDAAGNNSAQSSPPATARTLAPFTISSVAPSNYVVTTFDVGSTLFIDRSYAITSMPAQYRGYQGIRTANNDKDNTSLDFHFTISSSAEIYVCMSGNTKPTTPLLTGFVDTGDDIGTTDPTPTYSVFHKVYPAGVVSLGPKPGAGNGSSMFFVLANRPAEDTQSPSMPAGVATAVKSPSVVQVSWTASTDNIGVTGYKVYRNGSQLGISVATSYTDTGLSSNTTYSYTVSAYDAVGNSSAQSSPPTTAKTMAAIGIASAKQSSNTTVVGLVNKTVTAAYSNYLYIEETNRYAGIKVVPVQMPAGLAADKRVDIGGTMQTGSDGERYIGNATVTIRGTGSVASIGLNNRALGGGDWFYVSGSGAGQKGTKTWQMVKQPDESYVRELADVAGLNNIGLLIQIWGKVTYKGSDYFYVDDGSALDDGSGNLGVRVQATGLSIPDKDSYVVVTGISSCHKDGEWLYRMVRARGQTDIVVLL